MRKPLVSNVPIPGSQGAKSVAYQAWIMEYQYQAVTEAWGSSNIGWPEWTANALSRLYDAEKETPGTIKLLLSSWPRGRKGKKGCRSDFRPKLCLIIKSLPQTITEPSKAYSLTGFISKQWHLAPAVANPL